MTLLAWIAVGLIAGLVARMAVVRGIAFRILDCMLVGSLGALLGGSVVGLLATSVAFELVGAVAGAILMLAVCACAEARGRGRNLQRPDRAAV